MPRADLASAKNIRGIFATPLSERTISHKSGMAATQSYLDRFFGQLLFGEQNALRNRSLHVAEGNLP
jgi:hypothetical protein